MIKTKFALLFVFALIVLGGCNSPVEIEPVEQVTQEAEATRSINDGYHDDIAGLFDVPNDPNRTKLITWASTGTRLQFRLSWDSDYHTASGSYNSTQLEGKVVSGDFNNDGHSDVAAINGTRIHVWLGGGSIYAPTMSDYSDWGYVPGGATAGLVVAGDFDADGKDDIAVLAVDGTSVQLFLSQGTSFQRYLANVNPTGTNWYPYNVVAGSFYTGTVDYGTSYGDDIAYYGSDNKIHVLLCVARTGTGQDPYYFGSRTSWGYWENWSDDVGVTLGSISGRMVVGDFNGDLQDDIAAIQSYNYGYYSRAVLWVNNQSFGDLKHEKFDYEGVLWQSSGYYYPTQVTKRVVAGDFNGDGNCDMAGFYEYPDDGVKLHVWITEVYTYGIESYLDNGVNGWWAYLGGAYPPSNLTGKVVGG